MIFIIKSFISNKTNVNKGNGSVTDLCYILVCAILLRSINVNMFYMCYAIMLYRSFVNAICK